MKKVPALLLSACAPGLALSLGAPLSAQRDPAAGFGAETLNVPVDSLTGEFGNLGVDYLPATEEIFVTTRVDPAVAPGQHFVSVLDPSGSLLRSWLQPPLAQTSAWGFRDGADDGANLMFGFELGVQVVDVDGGPVSEVLTENQPTPGQGRPIPGSLIAGDALSPERLSVMRALAYDPAGNGGDGSLWTANFGSSVFEVDLAGDVLRSYPNAGESSYGMAIDPATGNLWIHSQTNPRALIEYDRNLGVHTGSGLDNGSLPGGIAGGLDLVAGSVLRGAGASGFDLLALRQSAEDSVLGRRLHLDVAGIGASTNTRLGTEEPLLLAGQTYDSFRRICFFEPSDRASLGYSEEGGTFEWDLDISGRPGDGMGSGGWNGVPAVYFAQTSPDADPDSRSSFVRELVHLQTNGVTVDPASVTPRAFPTVMGNDPGALTVQSFELPDVPFQDIGECVRMQAVYLDSSVDLLPLAATNQVRWCRVSRPAIFIDTVFFADGENSFNSDTTKGFFALQSETTHPSFSIVSLSLSWVNPSNPIQLQNGMRFDTDETNMADVFLLGNGGGSNCSGTYRNNTDVEAGLIYAGTELTSILSSYVAPPPCTIEGAQTGFQPGAVLPASGADFQTLTFRFTPGTLMNGQVFEFDCDTDGGLGASGDAMQFLVVAIERQNGSVSVQQLSPVAGGCPQAFASF